MSEVCPRLCDSPEAQKILAVTLYDCFQTMPQFGKDPEALESMMRLFSSALAEFTGDQIVAAFAYFLKTFNGMPTPADIATIINRGGKPPFERTIYISIRQKPAEERTGDEWQYLRDYEKFIITGEMQ